MKLVGGSTSSEAHTASSRSVRGRRRARCEVDGFPPQPSLGMQVTSTPGERVRLDKVTLVMDVNPCVPAWSLRSATNQRVNCGHGHQVSPRNQYRGSVNDSLLNPLGCAREIGEAVKAHRGRGLSGDRATQYHPGRRGGRPSHDACSGCRVSSRKRGVGCEW